MGTLGGETPLRPRPPPSNNNCQALEALQAKDAELERTLGRVVKNSWRDVGFAPINGL